jgi:hypothetical protein
MAAQTSVVLASLILTLWAGGQAPPPLTADALAARAAEYLTAFQKDFAQVIGEEHYVQTLTHKRVSDLNNVTQVERRATESEILSSQDAFQRWVSFRDVISVEGRPVRDRDQRLEKLFLANAENRFDEARRIAEEGTRFNLGTVQRTVNLPTMPLVFLTPANLLRMKFKLAGADRVNGVDVMVVEFRENQRPTIVRVRAERSARLGPRVDRTRDGPRDARVSRVREQGVQSVGLDHVRVRGEVVAVGAGVDGGRDLERSRDRQGRGDVFARPLPPIRHERRD